MNESEKNKILKNNSKKPPLAPFVWLIIFLVFATLLVFRFNPGSGEHVEWTPLDFEQNLHNGTIVSVDVIPESDRILNLKGKFVKNNTARTEETDLSEAQGTVHTFSTRIYATDDLVTELQNAENVDVNFLQRDNWWKGLIANLIIGLVIIGLIYLPVSSAVREKVPCSSAKAVPA